MQPIQLFELTSKQAHWLTVRQSVVAGNIANVNTPGYARGKWRHSRLS
jgi:flagellar basal-body rod protein FlgB